MSRLTFLLHTLLFHWRTNLAVGLGVVVGTAVIGGALIVGDSVRGSLRDMTFARLGNVDFALTGPRFITSELAKAIDVDLAGMGKKAIGCILLTSTAEKRASEGTQVASRAGRVNVIALDANDWPFLVNGAGPPSDGELVINERLARDLQARRGDDVVLSVELPSDIPRDALLGKRDESAVQIELKIGYVLNHTLAGSRFGLHPDQQIPANAYLSLKTLQERLRLDGASARRRDRKLSNPRVNTILVSTLNGRLPPVPTDAFNHLLHTHWRLDDLHARIVVNEQHGYLSLESERMILERPVADAARKVADQLRIATSPVLAYIANEISVVDRKMDANPSDGKPAYSRYAIVAGLDPAVLAPDAPPPFGPFRFQSPESPPLLGEGAIEQTDAVGEIILNDWLAEDLGAKVGDQVCLTYHIVGSHGELPEEGRQFIVRGIVALDDTVAADRGLIPEVRGITDVNSFDEWDAPFPMKKVTPRDDEYWKKYRATPKALVTLKAAQHLWQSRYGDLTSLRFAPVSGNTLEESRAIITRELLKQLKPEDLGLAFQPVKAQGLAAASGTTDFSGLFIGFSFFLILSAMILIGMLFRLGIERRAANVGLLLATGFSQGQVRSLLLAEGGLVVAAGGIAGVLAAVRYAGLMIYGLKTWWIGAIGTRFLELHVLPASVITGGMIAAVAAIVAIWFGIRRLWKMSPRRLLAGVTEPAERAADQRGRGRKSFRMAHILAGVSVLLTVAVVIKLVPDREAFAGFSWPTIAFFVVGMNTLAAGLVYLSAWVDSDRAAAIRGAGVMGSSRLGVRNAARHRSRSVLSTGLIASATFLIVAIAAGHRNPAAELPDRSSGNGGFTLVAESTIPVLYDLNTQEGRSKLDLDDHASSRTLSAIGAAIAFRVNPGENASCLNIYQTTQPTILGVPAEMIRRGGFKFIGAGQGNPWEKLREVTTDGAIPVFGDMNTLQYSLHVGPGQTLKIRSEGGEMVNVRIAGMFDSSVFQGVLLMDEGPFQKLFPSRIGYQYFLFEVPPAEAASVGDLLESKLPGFDAERVVDRLASFLAVQNTYLSTFQALGGLGLLLGTIGLATVMLRNVLERRSELALLRATGFRDTLLAALVLSETALLLGWGLATGAVSALLAMLPHLLSTGADAPWRDVAAIIAAVFVVGMLAALVAVRASIHTPVLATLRAE
jgi:ABC-type antimicrobial peptide transport system permease subunit